MFLPNNFIKKIFLGKINYTLPRLYLLFFLFIFKITCNQFQREDLLVLSDYFLPNQ